MNDRETIVYNHFIKPFTGKKEQKVGIELEFPIQSDSGELPKLTDLQKVLPALEKYGFSTVFYSADDVPIWSKNKEGTYLSFDTSFLNFEFSMHIFDDVWEANQCFETYFKQVDEIMRPLGFHICGKAVNEQAINHGESYRIKRKKDEICEMEYEFLKKNGANTVFTHEEHPNFFTLISSIQTHFDTDEQHLVRLMNLLSILDFIELLLFANSLYRIGKKQYLDSRYYFYRTSAFAPIGLTGCSDMEYKSLDDIVKDYATRKIPWPVEEGGAELLYSYRNEELTRYGTIEYRVADTQPLDTVMLPAAFNYGLVRRLDETEEALQKIKRDLFPSFTNNELADRASLLDGSELFLKKEFYEELWKLYGIAESSLTANERTLLSPLQKRIDGLQSPARKILETYVRL